MKTTTYNTRQRNLVLGCIANSDGEHITADDIVRILQQGGESVGKSTVYRHLGALAEQGVVRKFNHDGGSACYQYLPDHTTCSSHYHLKCNSCGELLHADSSLLDDAIAKIWTMYSFKIDNIKTIFYGTCNRCENSKL